MTSARTNQIFRIMTIAGAVGGVATVAYGLVKASKNRHNRKAEDEKLDEKLNESMDCSDATATY